jgi:hypothetical protein
MIICTVYLRNMRRLKDAGLAACFKDITIIAYTRPKFIFLSGKCDFVQ